MFASEVLTEIQQQIDTLQTGVRYDTNNREQLATRIKTLQTHFAGVKKIMITDGNRKLSNNELTELTEGNHR